MRVLVCGGRDFSDYGEIDRVLSCIEGGIDVLMHGGAPGADTLAHSWARAHGIEPLVFNALWKTHGKAAGPLRNQRMIDEGKPTLCVAFPGGRGTADMVRRAEAAGVKVVQPVKPQ